ncbi:MAG: hypothetical protein ACI8Z1_000313 [Candidatus Azotimanducaceae bacterium]|jgi:hypothetical protein
MSTQDGGNAREDQAKRQTTALCAWCDAPRAAGSTCPKCGADYEKAARIKSGKRSQPLSKPSKVNEREQLHVERFMNEWAPVKDPAFEQQLSSWVIPCMLGLTFLMEAVGVGDGMLRIVFGMPVHELGHAIVGWLSGFNSVPTLWKTLIPENRGYIAPLILLAGSGYLIYYARLKSNGGLMLTGVTALILQFIGTFILELNTARLLVTWGGDGVGMMLAVGLMAGFSFGKRTGWYKDYLRWGFAFIGAAAFADITSPWWASLSDLSAVPYGMTGGTHTDTYKLIHSHGWKMDDVINRYVTLSVVCGFVLMAFYVRGIKQAKKAVLWLKAVTALEGSNSQETLED